MRVAGLTAMSPGYAYFFQLHIIQITDGTWRSTAETHMPRCESTNPTREYSADHFPPRLSIANGKWVLLGEIGQTARN